MSRPEVPGGSVEETASPPAPELERMDEWYRRFGGVAPGSGSEDLLDRGIAAIRAAIERPGRNREGAFALLAADGLLTLAVEASLEDEDPESAFRRILEALGRESDGATG